MEKPNRKPNRLPNFDYTQCGSYFITICTKDKKPILSEIRTCVGAGVPDRPLISPLHCGKIVEKYIKQLNDFYNDINIDKYVIMPNHIHLLITIKQTQAVTDIINYGMSGTPSPTAQKNNSNSKLANLVSTLKRFSNKEIGEAIFQRSYYDHIIRNDADYIEKWNYIDNNPIKWAINKNDQG